jgi:hypothetical protein
MAGVFFFVGVCVVNEQLDLFYVGDFFCGERDCPRRGMKNADGTVRCPKIGCTRYAPPSPLPRARSSAS